jgi:hypothetical protein
MGTILGNPFELNFAGVARNAETVVKRVETFTSGDTRYDVVSVENTACNAILQYGVYIMKITTLSTGAVRYKVQYTEDGRNPIDASYVRTSGSMNGYATLSEAEAERTTFIDSMNASRAESGCGDSSALNYSAASPRNGSCPCESAEPVWDNTKSWQETPTLVPLNSDRAGDCTCVYAPTYTEGGYIVEEWTYKGETNGVHEWVWEEKSSLSDIPRPDLTNLFDRIAKEGYQATGTEQGVYIIKPSLIPTTWKKRRVITATGFRRVGCMDNTAKNYVADAVAEDPENPCEYCTDTDDNASTFDQTTGKCGCVAGYKRGLLGKCVKDKKQSSSPSPDPTPSEEDDSNGMILAGIVGLGAVGIAISTVLMARKRGGQS